MCLSLACRPIRKTLLLPPRRKRPSSLRTLTVLGESRRTAPDGFLLPLDG
jgi:hypothetical protein